MLYKMRFFALLAVLAFFNTQCEDSTSSPQKSKVTFTNVYFSGEVDTDADDYASYAKLHYETEGNKDDLEVFVRIYKRTATENETASYSFYMQTIAYTTGKSDSRNVEIGLPNDSLTHGCYDFLIQLFFKDKPEEVHAEASLNSFSELKSVCFETQNEDALPELYISKSSLDFGASSTSQSFSIQNNGGGTLGWSISTNKTWLTVSDNSGSASSGSSDVVYAYVNRSGLSEGNHTGIITITPSVGSPININVTVEVESAPPELYVSKSSLDFGSSSTSQSFLIKNNGGGTLDWSISTNKTWLTVSDNSGSVSSGDYDVVYAYVNRSGLSEGNHTGIITITPNVGSPVDINVTVNVESSAPFTLIFNNPVCTDITIEVSGHSTKIAPVGGSATFEYGSNPGSISFYAYTYGKTNQGSQIGLKITWDYTYNVSGLDEKSFTLTIPNTYFFIYMKNNGSANLSPLYVNYDRTEQTMDNIVIPNDGVTYRTGYYKAFTNTRVRANLVGTAYYVYWDQGTNFILSWTDNQYTTLSNSSSSNPIVINSVNDPDISLSYELPVSGKPNSYYKNNTKENSEAVYGKAMD